MQKPVIMCDYGLLLWFVYLFLSDLRLLCEESEMFQQYFHTDQNEYDATRDLCGFLPVRAECAADIQAGCGEQAGQKF